MAATTTHTTPGDTTAPAKRDFRQEVTDRIVEMLDHLARYDDVELFVEIEVLEVLEVRLIKIRNAVFT